MEFEKKKKRFNSFTVPIKGNVLTYPMKRERGEKKKLRMWERNKREQPLHLPYLVVT